ncbi:TetR family transcriptional regulator (plasmid) [Pantoea cypripedii]|uniref:TetR family transcriptional regulator n=1 Tax=Pantoea cypripedii TaxID=55209 RepID=A0A6B9G9Y6_PANCY|nr:TetR family transcriptional regulator [Pantoea cypripedii]
MRNQEKLLSATAEVFVVAGVDAPIRQIATRAGVGTATIYRHFPTRADLIVAVFHYQVEECVAAGPRLLADASTPFDALRQWINVFVDFLVTKHGLTNAMQSDSESFTALHTHFIDRLLPVCKQLLDASVASGEIPSVVEPYELLRAIGNLCIGREDDINYTPQRMINLLLQGLRYRD